MRYAQIAIPRPLPEPLIYAVPAHLSKIIRPGQRVLVPFHKRSSIGYVISLSPSAPSKLNCSQIKEIKDILDESPVFGGCMLEFLRWLSSYYIAPLGEVCKSALPPRLSQIKSHTTTSRQTTPVEMGEVDTNHQKIKLNGDQQKVFEAIKDSLKNTSPNPILLHGITGSGKTQIYLDAFEELKKDGGQGLLLVPEISLTPQLVERFRNRFKDTIAIYHSGLTEAQRHKQWEKMRRGEVFAVVGTRSALFAPFEKLKLIIVDEEHDGSYKQEEGFRYHARDAAVVRAKIFKAAIVLGSATPSLESFSNAKKGKYQYYHLPLRATGAKLPDVEIVDMRKSKSILSDPLLEAISQTLDKKEQALIFLNRRGFSNFLLCADCGHVFSCPNCDISLTHHAAPKKLLCHYCDYAFPIPDLCPKCNSLNIKCIGHGTERLAQELAGHFPKANITRLDRDTQLKAVTRKEFLPKMKKGEIDILVGTQIIAKGHDFPNVTLVGVVDADLALHLPDFRAFERTFQILTQVAGRAGRAKKPGRVIIQTYGPEHHSLLCAKEHDFEKFYDIENRHRQNLGYPPYARLANIRFLGNLKDKTHKAARSSFEILKKHRKNLNLDESVDLLGPAPSPLPKVRGKFRWQLLIKARTAKQLSALLSCAASSLVESAPSGCRVLIDVDPLNML